MGRASELSRRAFIDRSARSIMLGPALPLILPSRVFGPTNASELGTLVWGGVRGN